MTEFSSEFITNWKHAIKVVVGVRGDMREIEKFALKALDHIEHLQAETKRLKHYLEEAAPAAACGKNPADYLARKVPTDLRDEIKRLQQRIAELEQERRWIPVSERLPEEGQIVIGWNWVSQTVAVVRYHKLTDKFYEYWRGGHMKIIYWQPLPQPPQEGE